MKSAERRANEQYTSEMCPCSNFKPSHSYLCRDHWFELSDDLRRRAHTLPLNEFYDLAIEQLNLRWPSEGETF